MSKEAQLAVLHQIKSLAHKAMKKHLKPDHEDPEDLLDHGSDEGAEDAGGNPLHALMGKKGDPDPEDLDDGGIDESSEPMDDSSGHGGTDKMKLLRLKMRLHSQHKKG